MSSVFSIKTQGGDARRQSRRLHAEQFCRAFRSGDLAVRLLEGGSNGVSFLTLQLLARERHLLCGWLGISTEFSIARAAGTSKVNGPSCHRMILRSMTF